MLKKQKIHNLDYGKEPSRPNEKNILIKTRLYFE